MAFFGFCHDPEKREKRSQPYNEVMLSNRPQAKICFKSDLNRLLIDFFDPISAVRSTRRDNLIRIQTIYIKNSSILIKNSLILIKNSQI